MVSFHVCTMICADEGDETTGGLSFSLELIKLPCTATMKAKGRVLSKESTQAEEPS
jgi:hypothetical protein